MSINLTTRLGNLELCSPIIVGSCPLTTDELQRIAMVSNGVGAIVLPSVQVEQEKPARAYVELVERIASHERIPVFGSLLANMQSGEWCDMPAKLEQAGASAIEISVDGCFTRDPRKLEDDLVAMVQRASESIDIPLILKLTRNFTSISGLVKRLRPFAQAIEMFGRAPMVDIELDSLKLTKSWGLTQPGSVVATLEQLIRTREEVPAVPLIACGGIGSSEDLIKSLLAGASAAMVTSAIYRNGTTTLGTLKEGLVRFMSDHRVSNIEELQALCPLLSDASKMEYKTLRDYDCAVPSVNAVGNSQGVESRCDRYGHPITEMPNN